MEGLNLTTESGREAYVTLLKLADGADTYYTTLEEGAEKVKSAIELMAEAIDEVLSNLSSAINDQINLSKSMASQHRSMANTYRQIIDSITDTQNQINGRGTAGAGQRFGSLFATAMTGDATALQGLPQAAQDLLSESLKSSSTAEEYNRTQGKVLLALEQAKTVSTGMVNWNEYMASVYDIQTGLLEDMKAQLELPDPNTDILNQQAGLLENIATILQQQTAQIVSGNQLVIDQTGKITIGNTLTGEQTASIITGNATSDAIKAITRENKSYSEQMLEQLAKSGTTQTSSLADVVTQTSLIVAAVHQLIQLTAEDLAAKQAAEAQAAADKLAAEQKAAADKLAAEQAAAKAAAEAAYNAQASTAESYRSQWDQFATSRASSAFTERQENIETGTPYSVTGYYSYSDAERAWLSQTAAAYQSAFAEAYKLWKAIPGHASGLSYVPTDNYLMRAHEGEAVLTKQKAVEWRGSKNNITLYTESNVALLAEIKKLNAKIDRLEAISYQTTKNTQKTAKTLEKFDYDGLPAERAA